MTLLLLFTMLCSGTQASDDGYQLQVQPVVWAQEGLCVFVPCTFTYPHDSQMTYTDIFWYRLSGKQNNQKEEHVATRYWNSRPSRVFQGRFQLVGNPEDRNCSLLITDIRKTDQGMYFFRMERDYPIRYSDKNWIVSLEVTNLMKPDIYILEPLWLNHWGTVICVFNATFDGCPAPSFSWMGAVLSTSRSQFSTRRSSVLKIAPQPQDQGTSLTCSVRFAQRGQNFQKTVMLDVASPLSHVGASTSFHLQAQQGSFLKLLCEASSHPPASLSWSLGNRVLACSRPEDPKVLALELPFVQMLLRT